VERTCVVCGRQLPVGCSHRRLYCDRRCTEKALWAQVKADPERLARERAKNKATQRRNASAKRERTRAKWVAEAPARRRAAAQRKLGSHAAGTRSTPRKWYMGWCAECGTAWVDNQPARAVCSQQCGKRKAKRYRRRLKQAAYVEDVWRSKVYERDHWHCQLCHKPVRRDKPVPHPLAPTLDHIVPLARGGEHSYANVQLAHFICNAVKSDGPCQLRLCA
jgi:5-methylcytosine-specific restriction endonuclease McrA